MPDPLHGIRSQYQDLSNAVRIALRTQVGNQLRLGEVRARALGLADAAATVHHHDITQEIEN